MKKSLLLLLFLPIVTFAKVVDPSEIEFTNENYYQEYRNITIKEEVLDVYSGPSKSYEVLTQVKEGNEFKFKYVTKGFAFIESNNLKGWIELKDKDLLMESFGSYLTTKKVKLLCGTIPVNTVIEKPYVKNIEETKVLISYNGCTELVNMNDNTSIVSMDLYNKIGKYLILDGRYSLYEEANPQSREITYIPRNTVITQLAYIYKLENNKAIIEGDKISFYVDYDGLKGWVFVNKDKYKDFKTKEEAEKKNKTNIIIKYGSVLCIVILLGFVTILLNRRDRKK